MREQQVPAIARVPPPVLFAAMFLLGLAVQRRLWPSLAAPVLLWARALAGLTIVAGVLVAAAALRLFGRSRTTLVPHGEPAALVVDGPYRFTRNPMYVSLTLLYLGSAIWTRTWFAVILLPFVLSVINWLVIPMEEERLRHRFAAAYGAYAARVRRWL
jgi:protein-S-isoprenylcysteine O-methyltransferase Ste14